MELSFSNKRGFSTFLSAIVVLAIVAAIGAIIFSASKQSSPTTNREVTNVKLALKWLHQSQFAGNYVAEEMGIYQQHGLEVELIEGGVNKPSIKNVVDGNAHFGVAGADDLIKAVSEGTPVKAIAVVYRLSPVVLMAHAETGIKTPYDFVGKTIGRKVGTGTELSYIATVNKLGIDREEINEELVQNDMTPFYEKKVDVWMGFRINESYVAEKKGYKINLIKPEEWGVSMYADVLFTTLETVEKNPELVEAFVKATIDGWKYAISNEEGTLNYVMKYASNSDADTQSYMLNKSIPLINVTGEKIGLMKESDWQNMINILSENKIVEKTLTPDQVYTNEFVD